MKHLNIKVTGIVQGVYFRANTRNEALRAGIKGFVKNETDGSVYIEAEGSEEQLHTFVNWCRHGTGKAVVENVSVSDGPLNNFNDFTIRY